MYYTFIACRLKIFGVKLNNFTCATLKCRDSSCRGVRDSPLYSVYRYARPQRYGFLPVLV